MYIYKRNQYMYNTYSHSCVFVYIITPQTHICIHYTLHSHSYENTHTITTLFLMHIQIHTQTHTHTLSLTLSLSRTHTHARAQQIYTDIYIPASRYQGFAALRCPCLLCVREREKGQGECVCVCMCVRGVCTDGWEVWV